MNLLIALLLSVSFASVPVPVPKTPKRPVTTEYHQTKVVDDYIWLEDTNNKEVKAWTEQQDKAARGYLSKLPGVKNIKAQLKKWNAEESANYRYVTFVGGTYFALKSEPGKNQPMLVSFASPQDLKNEKVVVDPNTIDKSGKTSMDFFVPSHDGKLIAVCLSKGGAEIGAVHIFDVKTKKELKDKIPNVNRPTGGGSVSWTKDNQSLYYTRYPQAGERPKEDMDFFQQIYIHKLGTENSKDEYVLGKDFPRIAEIFLEASPDGSYTVATVANGDGGEFVHYISGPEKTWKQFTEYSDKVVGLAFGQHSDLYLLSRKGSPKGKILKLALKDAQLSGAQEIVPESEGVIKQMIPTENKLFVVDLFGGPSQMRIFDQTGKALGKVETPPVSSISWSFHTTKDDILLKLESYVLPAAWYDYDTSLKKTQMAFKSPVDFKNIEVKREFAKSKDGTLVPLTLLYKKGTKLDGKNPTILYGYGGYGISLTPRFSPDLNIWFENGGIQAIANLRGGGEYGEEWHLGGNLAKKQNVFDDFIACAEFLIEKKYTNPKKLAVEGGSNGGLLMGAALTQRPELFGAVVSHVGIYDMLRVENDANGAFNVTEFGTVKDPNLFKVLYSYSPLHQVKDGVSYPPVLLLTGANDGRVNPYHSKKMAARLQQASPKDTVLLRVTFDGGHGIGASTSERIDKMADVYAFLLAQLK